MNSEAMAGATNIFFTSMVAPMDFFTEIPFNTHIINEYTTVPMTSAYMLSSVANNIGTRIIMCITSAYAEFMTGAITLPIP